MIALPDIVVEPVVRAALLEDLGRAGDITTDAVTAANPDAPDATVALVAREAGVVAGLDCARLAWTLLDPRVRLDVTAPDGTRVRPGDTIATVTGPARALLTGERVALNLLCHLCGIATATAQIADAIADTATHVVCTRKTTPGLRALEKYAVRAGGGRNHRFGLDDAVLVKDNHIAVAGGLTAAVRAVRAHTGHMVAVEVEVDTLDQLRELLALQDDPRTRVDAVLLDNMTPEQLREAVALVDGRLATEASGRVDATTAPVIAATGVDMISVGRLTHSAAVLDIGLDHLG